MDGFPTEEEEFELMYSDELELLKEQDANFQSQAEIGSQNQNRTSKVPTAQQLKSNSSSNKANDEFPTEGEEYDLVRCDTNINIHAAGPSKNLSNRDIRSGNFNRANEFPTEEEEFELMNADDLELLREQDIGERIPKSRKVLNFNKSPQNGQTQSQRSNGFDSDFVPLSSESEGNNISKHNEVVVQTNMNKRTIEELFGDIDDLLSEDVRKNYESASKRHKKGSKENADLALIEHILTLRKLSNEQNLGINFGRDYTSLQNKNADNISRIVPKYPFVGVNNHNGDRIYVRFHSEEYEKEEMKRVTDRMNFTGVMGQAFKDTWTEAAKLINQSLNLSETDGTEITNNEDLQVDVVNNKSLWVDLYKPRKYYELLSDESTNRILLRWLKLWDKVVFGIRPKLKQVKPNEKNFNNRFKKQILSLELDEHGRPEYKVALLCGPPGLGKTTLAHMVAKHAGYNVVEINASDDRNLDSFRTALENATSMRSVLDQEKRPNCLIFDEIDGAPSPSIDFLIKFINGGHVIKAKKGKNRTKHVLKRPIICICNDAYVPSLRPLRQIAFVVNFPQTSSTRLAERLSEIARRERVKSDMGTLLALAEKSHNDIRSCLSFLHFFKSQNKPVTLSDVLKTSVGEKDVQKGLFSVWNDIFQIERATVKKDSEEKCVDVSVKTRMSKVLETVQSFGDYDRVMQGVFENYPKVNVKDSSLSRTCEALDWFCLNDMLNKHVLAKQDYSLTTYLPYGFVVWHLVFASFGWQKISYPNRNYEVRTRKIKQQSIINELIRGMRPCIRAYTSPSSLKMEITPYLTQIIVPNLRPVNLHLYTQQEKDQLRQVVHIMIDYNLNYTQERTPEGNYVYNLDPNLEELVQYPTFKPKKVLTYANRQLIAREVELEKMRMVENQKAKEDEGKSTKEARKVEKKEQQVPNHLKKLEVKNLKPKETAVKRDFFGQEVKVQASSSNKASGPNIKHDIYYQFKEGFTNAVRKKIKIKQLK